MLKALHPCSLCCSVQPGRASLGPPGPQARGTTCRFTKLDSFLGTSYVSVVFLNHLTLVLDTLKPTLWKEGDYFSLILELKWGLKHVL